MVYPFLDPVTKEKIIMVPPAELRSVLTQVIPPETLLREYGGDHPYVFDFDAYMRELAHEEEQLAGTSIPL